ncbi:MAG: M56 family metallopeptidase [Clostridiales bacterium]|nr:M56 family metallopeptidase [Clostridiales bacterium]
MGMRPHCRTFYFRNVPPANYLPSSLNETDAQYVLLHENAHLKRRDHLWKPIGFLLLTVYWFNPILWIAYSLFCKDIELACDERALKEYGSEIKRPYSNALINCSNPRRILAACPLAFGETCVKSRVKNVLRYKKPAVWIVAAAGAVCAVTAVSFMTNPKENGYVPNISHGQTAYYMYSFPNGAIICVSDDEKILIFP